MNLSLLLIKQKINVFLYSLLKSMLVCPFCNKMGHYIALILPYKLSSVLQEMLEKTFLVGNIGKNTSPLILPYFSSHLAFPQMPISVKVFMRFPAYTKPV